MSPLGIYGSPMHVLTNKKVEDKKACIKEQFLTATKDSFKATAAVAGTAGAAAGITAIVGKVKPSALDGIKNACKNISDKAMEGLGTIAEKGGKDIAEKGKEIVGKFSKIPVAGKIALAAGLIAAPVIGAIHQYNQIGKMGGIEGKHETK